VFLIDTFSEADIICSAFAVTSSVEDIETPCLTDVMERSVVSQPCMSAMEQMKRCRGLAVKRKISGKPI
jgi:hypothetical protein